ncbi:MAG: hypothetical protein P9M14_04180 [Candidatus Alcyoniella australis]|nr:hypothetical protein [Candidatus Alcyoniella australis]
MGRIADMIQMLKEQRLGFMMDEKMSGTHTFAKGAGPEGELPMHFEVTWGNKRMERFINPLGDQFMMNWLRGKVTVGGLCQDAPCEGTLELRYFQEGKIRYTFNFEANGKKYHYVGEKVDIRPWNLHRTHTTCYGKITEIGSGKVISEGIVYFKLNTMPEFMISARLG